MTDRAVPRNIGYEMADATGVFICPSCQAVVKGGPEGSKGLVCPECQHAFGPGVAKARPGAQVPLGRTAGRSSSVVRNLTAKKSPPVRPADAEQVPVVPSKTITEAKAATAHPGADEEMIMPDGTRRVRRRKRRKKDEKNKSLILFLVGWFCVIAIILALFKLGGDKGPKDGPADDTKEALADKEARNRAVMRKLIPKIDLQFKKFLFQPTVTGRTQFIDRSADLSLAFSRFYEMNSFPEPASEYVRRIDEHVLSFSDDEIAIETVWESEEGLKWGAVHVFDKGEGWKLDWEAFAPHSSESWAKFRANLGSKEGVFRLLVRKRVSTNEEEEFYLSFYRAPRVFETENEYKNTESPEVEVKTQSALGREFAKRWQNYEEKKAPYGSILARNLDPSGHMRITVRLAWEENPQGDEEMVLKEILGLSWFGKRIQDLHAEEVRKATEEAAEKVSEDLSGKS